LNEKQSNVTKTLHRMNKKLYGNEHGHKALFTEKRRNKNGNSFHSR